MAVISDAEEEIAYRYIDISRCRIEVEKLRLEHHYAALVLAWYAYWHTQSGESPVGQPRVLKLLSRRFWGLHTIHWLAWNLARRRGPNVFSAVPNFTLGGGYLGFPSKKTKNCQNANFFAPQGRTPWPMLVKSAFFMRVIYGKLGIYRQKPPWTFFQKFSESPSSETTF